MTCHSFNSTCASVSLAVKTEETKRIPTHTFEEPLAVQYNFIQISAVLSLCACACVWILFSLFDLLCHFFFFFFLMFSFMSSLCILGIHPLLDISSENIFSHSIGGLFVLLIVSFTVQKLFSLICPICLFLLLFPLPEETYPNKYY